MVECHEKRQFDGWNSQSGLKAAISGDIAIPPGSQARGRSKGVGSVEGEECDQIWAKFEPYIELWVNIPTLCGSHLGKMDPQASPNYAWQAAGGGSKCESSIKPSLVFHSH